MGLRCLLGHAVHRHRGNTESGTEGLVCIWQLASMRTQRPSPLAPPHALLRASLNSFNPRSRPHTQAPLAPNPTLTPFCSSPALPPQAIGAGVEGDVELQRPDPDGRNDDPEQVPRIGTPLPPCIHPWPLHPLSMLPPPLPQIHTALSLLSIPTLPLFRLLPLCPTPHTSPVRYPILTPIFPPLSTR
jgi:hypothetical protein